MTSQIEITVAEEPQVTVEVSTVDATTLELSAPTLPAIIELVTPGQQGPKGDQGLPGVVANLDSVPDVDTSNKVNKSILYYDESSMTFKADSTITLFTITDGGNF